MGLFFKRSESKNSIEYELKLPKSLVYTALFLGVISVVALAGVQYKFLPRTDVLGGLIVLVVLISWGFVALIQLEFLFIKFTLIRKLNKEGGKLLFPDTGSGSAVAAMTLGKYSPLILPGQKIRWQK